MHRLLLGALRDVYQESLMLGWNAKGTGAAYKGIWTAGTSTLSCRWSQTARQHIASLLGRSGKYVPANSSISSAPQPRDPKPRPRTSTHQQDMKDQMQPSPPHQASQIKPSSDQPSSHNSIRPKVPGGPSGSTSSETPSPYSQQQSAPLAAAQLDEHSIAAKALSDSANEDVAVAAPGHSRATSAVAASAVSPTSTDSNISLQLSNAPNPPSVQSQPGNTPEQSPAGQGWPKLPRGSPPNRPRPRTSSRRSSEISASTPSDSHPVPDKSVPKANAEATKEKQGDQPAAAQRPVQPLQPSQPATPQQQQQQQQMQQPPLNMQLRNSVNSRKQSAALVAPSVPLSQQAEDWVNSLGIGAAALQEWRAGMAHVHHPDPAQGQVEVLALPYYRQGTLVDLRYYQVENGQLVATWLAREAAAPFMHEQLVQDAKVLVFVNDELDAVLLSAQGIAAVALPKQRPVLDIPPVSQGAFQQQLQQEHSEHQQPPQPDQQQQPQQPWQPQQQPHTRLRPLLQVSHQREQQQFRSNSQQNREDPRLRLKGLEERIKLLHSEHRINASHMQSSSSSSNGADGLHSSEGLIVSDVLHHQAAGLNLMFPAATTAVIAMDSGQVGDTVSAELARLLGEVSCRLVTWPAPDAPADAAAQFALGCAAPDGTAPLAEQQYWSALEWQLEHLGISRWNFLLVHGMYQMHNQSGDDAVLNCINEAVIWPIPGLERFSDYAEQLVACYDTPDVGSLAVGTGWSALDECYKVAPGEVTIVTGVPNSGKSEWLDALAVNLALQHGWRFAVCSMEKRARDHARQLLEKIAGKPLLMAAYADNVDRMSEEELVRAYQWLAEHFYVIASGVSEMPKIQKVLEKAKAAKIHHNINGLIIDPYNELDPTRSGPGVKEHEHINELMAHLRRFARDNKVHCWLVAHPRQMGHLWTGQAPGLQDISGGANFHNKADNGIVVHRDWSKMKEMQQRAGKEKGASRRASRPSSPNPDGNSDSANGTAEDADNDPAAPTHNIEYEVQIKVEKIRNKTSGARGMVVLVYDRVTGRYHQVGEEPDRSCLWEESVGPIVTVEYDTHPPDQQIVQPYEASSSGSSNGALEEAETMQLRKEEAGV